MSGSVHFSIADGVGVVVFDRPAARNAMTWTMYDALRRICDEIAANDAVRVVTFRGAGGKAFVAGTDIAQFLKFEDADDGVRYETTIDACIGQIERLPVPTIAIIEGAAMGGGLALAAVCDLRIASPDSKFGVPIARTIGNCLSAANTARLVSAFGHGRATRLLLLADILGAEEALACGFLIEVAAADRIDERVKSLCAGLISNAPISMRVSKEALRRVSSAGLSDNADLIREAYGSEDFRTGVAAFLAKRSPEWAGR